jgi:hypothetical protein
LLTNSFVQEKTNEHITFLFFLNSDDLTSDIEENLRFFPVKSML